VTEAADRSIEMKRSKYTDEQRITVIKKVEAGAKVGEVCREYGISEHTFYVWRAKLGGMQVQDAKRLRALEEENAKLKRIVGEITVDNLALKDLLGKKF
jgi:putative transposase